MSDVDASAGQYPAVGVLMKPYFDNGVVQLYQTDAREIPIPDQSVHCVVTSPPYFGLRVYADNDERGIGLEASVDAYVANLVDVFREVKRVLRDDGVCWLNLGDSMSGSGKGPGQEGTKQANNPAANNLLNPVDPQGNRLGIPERVVMALQADGWIWRDTVIWAKKSAMPESVNGWRWERCRTHISKRTDGSHDGSTPSQEHHAGQVAHRDGSFDVPSDTKWSDCPGCPKCEANDGLVLRQGSWRTTSAHEYIYMLTKQMGYFCDAEAVKTASVDPGDNRKSRNANGNKQPSGDLSYIRGGDSTYPTANRRSVWNDISPEPYGGAHFATFPSDLPRICIQASTSEKGVCSECGMQWARVVEKQTPPEDYTPGYEPDSMVRGFSSATPGYTPESKTIGWRATCNCNADVIPATVLDPFAGTFTTGYAAQKLGRRAVGTDISESYLKQAVERLSGVTLPMGL